MNQSTSKISFTGQQPAAKRAEDRPDDAVHRVQVGASVEAASDYLPLPPVFATSQKAPEPEPVTVARQGPQQPLDDPKWHTANEPKPFRRPTPKPPGFAATGLMAQQQVGFFRRNMNALGVGGGVALTFVLGLVTAFALFGDRQDAQFSQPLEPTRPPVQETPTRSVAPNLTDVSAVTDSTVPTPSAPQDALARAVQTGLASTSQTPVLQASSAQKVEGDTLLNSIKLRQLREGVLGGLYSVVVVEKDGVRRVQFETLNVDMTAGYEEDLLVEAANNGLLELSGALRTPNGSLDTKTMIFDVVQRSLVGDESSASAEAALDMSRKVFSASIARTQFVQGQRIYTVQAGDSLAYIALQFFGMPGEYDRILDANRNTLQSPDKIQIGQRLVIPS